MSYFDARKDRPLLNGGIEYPGTHPSFVLYSSHPHFLHNLSVPLLSRTASNKKSNASQHKFTSTGKQQSLQPQGRVGGAVAHLLFCRMVLQKTPTPCGIESSSQNLAYVLLVSFCLMSQHPGSSHDLHW